MPPPTRHLVLDNAAAVALLSTRSHDPARAAVVEAVAAANGRRLVPTVVRVEAGWDRSDPRAADGNRLLGAGTDVLLDRAGANRAVQLRRAVATASVVDVAVAVAAEDAGRDGAVVEILTSDVGDFRSLAGQLECTVDVVRV